MGVHSMLLKHQAISIHSADKILIVLVQLHSNHYVASEQH